MFSLSIIIFQCDLQIIDAAISFPGSLFLTSPGVGERKALGYWLLLLKPRLRPIS